MSSFMEYLKKIHESSKVGIDPIMDSYPLMRSPIPILIILLTYWIFVFYAGPRFMRNRKPFDLQNIIISYNLYQVVFSSWLLWRGLRVDNARMLLFDFGCIREEKYHDVHMALIDLGWWYMINKIVELLDTVFFVLKKKQSHVSFLHVYHHSNMELLTFVFLKYLGGYQLLMAGFLNSMVHVIMYFYYLIAALGPKYRRFLFWKKFVTTIQILQFVIALLYFASIVIRGCNLPKTVTLYMTINGVIFLYLFIDFYRKTYCQPTTEKKISVGKKDS